eukprot:4565171-Pleurochrysis_carterae.AAC.1
MYVHERARACSFVSLLEQARNCVRGLLECAQKPAQMRVRASMCVIACVHASARPSTHNDVCAQLSMMHNEPNPEAAPEVAQQLDLAQGALRDVEAVAERHAAQIASDMHGTASSGVHGTVSSGLLGIEFVRSARRDFRQRSAWLDFRSASVLKAAPHIKRTVSGCTSTDTAAKQTSVACLAVLAKVIAEALRCMHAVDGVGNGVDSGGGRGGGGVCGSAADRECCASRPES